MTLQCAAAARFACSETASILQNRTSKRPLHHSSRVGHIQKLQTGPRSPRCELSGLIQVKGGSAAKPTAEDAKRLRIVARRHGACEVLHAAWKEGKAARFYSLQKGTGAPMQIEIDDLRAIFGCLHSRCQTAI